MKQMNNILLSTSTIAKNNNINADDLFNSLMSQGYISKIGKCWRLTHQGINIGGGYNRDAEGEIWIVWDVQRFNEIIGELVSHISNVTFKYPIDFLSIKKKFGQKVCGDTWESLDRGKAILQTKDQLKQYLFSHGRKHHAKILDAYKALFKEISVTNTSQIEIVDYGCGQGLASIVLLNFLDKNQFPINNIIKITLIEPSESAIKMAENYLKGSATILTINKKLDDITVLDLKTDVNAIKIHLFSNILDMGGKYFRIENLAKKIRSSQTGDNYFVCVSATNEDKLHKFTEEITQVKIKSSTDELLEDLSGSYNLKGKVIFSPNTILDTVKFISKDRSDIHNPSNSNRPWKRIHMVFKKEF